ncbi:Disintegrin [Ancylostoma caninum]|uniref:Disintegrin n=1 Tax=Ancylostoma caninum TaxID=29170 RepID=A0A368FZW7_ANCCA|nr:Disintegrin [Ancylostoma caninum]
MANVVCSIGLFIIIILHCIFAVGGVSLRERTGDYDVVHIDETYNVNDDVVEKVSFTAFGRRYVAVLNPSTDVFDPYSKVKIGDEIAVPLDRAHHYRGYLNGNLRHTVVLSRLWPGVYIGSIFAGNDSIYIEPASPYFDTAGDRDVLVFRPSSLNSSVFFRSLSRDGVHVPLQATPISSAEEPLPRARRQVIPTENEVRNRCPLKIVADYKFFSIVGKNNTALTTRYIVNMVARVNEIYTVVNWDEGQEETEVERGRFVNMGFSIKELKILDKPSRQPGHYNSRDSINNGVWNSNRLLEAFTREEGSPKFCLVHLLTAQSFSDSAHIGLAYVADTRGGPGGICSDSAYVVDRQISYNTVFTSAMGNTGLYDYPLVTKEAEIVVAHEYAHSWGAQHDGLDRDADGREECLPDYAEGGNYIMHMYAQNGYDPNNIRFSPCSRKSIRRMLERRWHRCFEPEKASFCGNGVVEEGEECDEGNFFMNNGSSLCCTADCRLAPSAQCSPHNQPCCNDACSYHPANHICLPGDPLQCKASSYCTGHSGECPLAPAIPNGSPCLEDGECQDGVCLPYCERQSIAKKSCICEEIHLSCRRCCRDVNGTGLCEPEIGAADLVDGTWCAQGYCRKSKCVNEVADYVTRHLNVLTDRSRIWPIIQSNIVAIIVFLSVAVWIPIGYCIKRADGREISSTRRAGRVRTVDVVRQIDFRN